MRLFSLLLPAMFTCLAAIAQPKQPGVKFSSAYTDMNRGCKEEVDAEAEARGQDPLVFCKGYGGYRIKIYYSAWASHVMVEDAAGEAAIQPLGTDHGGYGMTGGGEKIEWRMAAGKPFAVIMRIGTYSGLGPNDDPFFNRTGSQLIIKGLPGWSHIDAVVDGAAPDANARARAAADAGYARRR